MANKPKRCCHPNCEECPYVYCRWDCEDVGTKDIENHARFQNASLNGNITQYKYNHSEKGKETHRKWEEAHKEERREYFREYQRKRIKNETQEARENRLKRQAEYDKKHREQKREYDRQRYLRKKAEKRAAELAATS